MQTLAVFVVFLPAFAALIAGLLQRQVGDRGAQLLTTGAVSLAALFSILIFAHQLRGGADFVLPLLPWIQSGSFEVTWAIKVDTLTAVMLCVVTIVSAIVHGYAIGYMADDGAKARFQAYLSLFTFAMLMLVTADNLVQLFFGWEGVGVASYLLIGFWYHKDSANQAAMKAFIVNRVGDFGFALGIFGVFWMTGSIYFDEIFAAYRLGGLSLFGWSQATSVNVVTMLLFIGAMGKSAQFFLHTWLPDAMEGPTPVSALIHAATMVTAGVFLLARMSPIFIEAQVTMAVVTLIGATTALFAATVGLTQFDIKRVIAYSTCSQLGYMFFALGLGLVGPAIFHLATHAFFKALLFLGAGSVIHALHHEQDMRQMGGLWRKLPWTHAYMLIGSLAIAGMGVPIVFGHGIGFAGFHSKDAIIEGAYVVGLAGNPLGYLGFWVGLVAAVLTAFYSWRLLYLTFYGRPRGNPDIHAHAHEAPGLMRYPLIVLALGAVSAGYLFQDQFVRNKGDFWGSSIALTPFGKAETPHDASPSQGTEPVDAGIPLSFGAPPYHPLGLAQRGDVVAVADAKDGAPHPGVWVFFAALVAGALGILAAVLVYRNDGSGAGIARRFSGLNRFFAHKWYFDEAYEALFVRPARRLGHVFWKVGDGALIDGLGPNGFATLVRRAAARLSAAQTGYVYHYAFGILVGLVVLVTWFLLYAVRG